jgi:hypothetical protein
VRDHLNRAVSQQFSTAVWAGSGCSQARELPGVAQQREEAVPDQVRGGLVAGDQQQVARREELGVAQRIALLDRHQRRIRSARGRARARPTGPPGTRSARPPRPPDRPAVSSVRSSDAPMASDQPRGDLSAGGTPSRTQITVTGNG